MLQGGTKNTRSNLVLWIAVSVMSIIGLGANVYKANTGAKLEWLPMVGEACVLLAAGCFIYSYFKSKKQKEENKKE